MKRKFKLFNVNATSFLYSMLRGRKFLDLIILTSLVAWSSSFPELAHLLVCYFFIFLQRWGEQSVFALQSHFQCTSALWEACKIIQVLTLPRVFILCCSYHKNCCILLLNAGVDIQFE